MKKTSKKIYSGVPACRIAIFIAFKTDTMRIRNTCLHCDTLLEGRSDKKYCDVHCKSAHQYEMAKQRPQRFFDIVDNALKNNRKILKKYNQAGKATIRAEILLSQGFDPNYFTHYWKNQKGDVYLFIYEYGFLTRTERGKQKYILVLWQDYMQKRDRGRTVL